MEQQRNEPDSEMKRERKGWGVKSSEEREREKERGEVGRQTEK